MNNPILYCENLSKQYEKVLALDDVSLSCAKGELLAIGGASGSGKSTLLSLLSGLEGADSGETYIEGQPLSKLSEDELALLRREKIGFVFQSFNLIPTLSALENVEFPLFPMKLRRNEMEERAKKLLEAVGLHDRLSHLPAKLSGGEKQRVAVARALINNPKIVFADEPTGNLDSKNGAELFTLIKRLNGEMNVTFIIVTHDEGFISKADRVIRMKDGKITG
ncbi:MAG: ABC transporter ATP-binding protein [Synergistaceae bacterium]|jgi:putative ABC transport system ATP-binding protein|nr:ABC transporter ATP-binding protein [Synergistaceae bacterium]